MRLSSRAKAEPVADLEGKGGVGGFEIYFRSNIVKNNRREPLLV